MTDQTLALEALTNAVTEITNQVKELSRKLTIDQRTVRRTRLLSRITVVLSALALISAVANIYLFTQIHTAQVQTCENGNDARAAQLNLWSFVLTASAASNPNQTPQQKKVAQQFQTYIVELFAPRDCSNLNKKYKTPEPPPVLTQN